MHIPYELGKRANQTRVILWSVITTRPVAVAVALVHLYLHMQGSVAVMDRNEFVSIVGATCQTWFMRGRGQSSEG